MAQLNAPAWLPLRLLAARTEVPATQERALCIRYDLCRRLPRWQVKLSGIADALGGLGLILPMVLNIAPVLSPIAGIALEIIMIGAIAVHVRRKEHVAPSFALLVLSAASAVLGFFLLA